MSQKSITTFFQKAPLAAVKRNIIVCEADVENINMTNIHNIKKVKIDHEDRDTVFKLCDGQDQKTSDPGVVEERKNDVSRNRIEMKKLSAELKLCSKAIPAVHPNMGISWFQALRKEFDKPYFKTLSNLLEEERSDSVPIFPKPDQIWTWTRECAVDNVKVVIIGQDPYHNPGQAHGLSFSVPIGVAPPPSLLNMYKELESDIEGFKKPGHGYLVGWARQGVLLLNAVLTVRCRTPNSHKDRGWEKLTDAAIQHLNSNRDGLVFLLWGAYAQKKAAFVDQNKHHLLKSVHPSPLSASRGFFGCKHFSRCNQLLEDQGKTPIDWSCLPAE